MVHSAPVPIEAAFMYDAVRLYAIAADRVGIGLAVFLGVSLRVAAAAVTGGGDGEEERGGEDEGAERAHGGPRLSGVGGPPKYGLPRRKMRGRAHANSAPEVVGGSVP